MQSEMAAFFFYFQLIFFRKTLFFLKNKTYNFIIIVEDSIAIVICSRDNGEAKEKLINHIKKTSECNTHTFFMYNPDGVGLSEVYNKMLLEENCDHDIIVFMHDDIEFLRKGWGREIIRLFNEHEDYGIIGVAGSAQFDNNGAWWQCEKRYGQVLHRHEGKSWLTAFSPLLENDLQEVCVVDGLFMAVHRKRITKQFNEAYKFDYYDICFCLDNYIDNKTKIGVTTNIRIAHNSIGEMRESWYINREKVIESYKNLLPIDIDAKHKNNEKNK